MEILHRELFGSVTILQAVSVVLGVIIVLRWLPARASEANLATQTKDHAADSSIDTVSEPVGA